MVVDAEARDAVIDAFQRARSAGRKTVDCYLAAVDAWCAVHPDHNRTHAATRAVEVVHQSFGTLHDIAKG